jgi:5-methylcytosine-specific restriction endonuclease McrA
MSKTLILNSSTEPLTFVSARRAMILVLKDKAEIVECHSQMRLRSEKEEYPYPLVIKLLAYVEIPRRFRGIITNSLLFARDHYTCQYCGRHRSKFKKSERLTMEHVKPVSRGGKDSWDNVTTACSTCNHRKRDRLPFECGMYPKTTPYEPRYIAIILFGQTRDPRQLRYIEPYIVSQKG